MIKKMSEINTIKNSLKQNGLQIKPLKHLLFYFNLSFHSIVVFPFFQLGPKQNLQNAMKMLHYFC